MRQSALFSKTRRDAPSDETAKSAELLIRAGFVRKEMAGVYAYLPLGYKTLQNIIAIIREEMNAIGGEEVLLTALQDSEVWKKSGRWSDDVVDVWFKTRLKNDTELGLANTHEEALTNVMRDHISSYKDLPCAVYQFQTKFRNELRAKSGIMRTREFIMKDLYSFSKDAEEHDAFYERASEAYTRIFERMGIGAKTFKTFASGGSFSKYSHEFQTECEAGEDIIYIDDAQGIAINKEVYDDAELFEANNLTKDSLREAKAIEVGNIFTLGTKYADALALSYMNESGESIPVFMGSYGIGPGRVMGTIAELLADEKGLVWPESIAPFTYHLINVMPHDEAVCTLANGVYDELTRAGASVLFDDRDMRAGEKFAESDLLGMPWRITVGKDALAGNGFELTNRQTGEMMLITKDELVRRI